MKVDNEEPDTPSGDDVDAKRAADLGVWPLTPDAVPGLARRFLPRRLSRCPHPFSRYLPLSPSGTPPFRSRPSFTGTMDYDRKSTVSSFYGGRRTSGDVLSNDFPPTQQTRPRVDSTNSFYGGNRMSRADGYEAPTAGYNANSYFDAGRTEPVKGGDEEAAWDVYADFNNAGPRYSTAFGMGDTGCVS